MNVDMKDKFQKQKVCLWWCFEFNDTNSALYMVLLFKISNNTDASC